jgi:hypothetical protein
LPTGRNRRDNGSDSVDSRPASGLALTAPDEINGMQPATLGSQP